MDMCIGRRGEPYVQYQKIKKPCWKARLHRISN